MQVAQEMLFVWPESGAMAALEAANKEPVLSPHMTKQVRLIICCLIIPEIVWLKRREKERKSVCSSRQAPLQLSPDGGVC